MSKVSLPSRMAHVQGALQKKASRPVLRLVQGGMLEDAARGERAVVELMEAHHATAHHTRQELEQLFAAMRAGGADMRLLERLAAERTAHAGQPGELA